MKHNIELEIENDGRWIAAVVNMPGVLVYGNTKEDAISGAEALVQCVEAEKPGDGESPSFNG